MAGVCARRHRLPLKSCREFLRDRTVENFSARRSFVGDSSSRREARVGAGGFLAGILASTASAFGVVLYFLDRSVKAMGNEITVPSYPWAFDRLFTSLDHSALRRGWQVYRTVCQTCHSLQYVRFMYFIDVTHTVDEAKKIAAEYEVRDGPDEEGNYYDRPCKLSDTIPPPYPNEEAARAANFGAHPPDLTFIVLGRENGIDYVFSMLTGWMDPPAGVTLDDGQYFNIYFPGGATRMAQMLHDGILEYEDGTPATRSQMAKDVVEFLCWTASQEHDERKLMAIRSLGVCAILLVATYHLYRRTWSHMRSMRIAHIPKRDR